MTKPLKTGYLLRYKRRLFSTCWREEFIVLYEDSTVAWFKDKSHREPHGGVVLREAPEMMAVGLHTARVPDRPSLPHGCNLRQLMAFATASGQKVHWFVAKSEQEVTEWMTAITNTLPLPPEPPIYTEIDEVIVTEIYEKLKNKDCRKHAASELPAIAPPPVEKEKRASNIQEAATGVMMAAGLTDWGWGSGLGWNKSWSAIFNNSQWYGGETLAMHANEHLTRQSNLWIHGETNSSGHNYYDDYNHDNGLDVDFGLDFSF